jgi:hypothetical protein
VRGCSIPRPSTGISVVELDEHLLPLAVVQLADVYPSAAHSFFTLRACEHEVHLRVARAVRGIAHKHHARYRVAHLVLQHHVQPWFTAVTTSVFSAAVVHTTIRPCSPAAAAGMLNSPVCAMGPRAAPLIG